MPSAPRPTCRNLPVQVEEGYIYGGAFDHWLRPDAVGSLQNPSWGQLDLRVAYRRTETRFKPEFFLDILNLTDEQGVTRQQDLEAGNGGIGFNEPLSWVPPRRLYLGVRLGF